MEVSPRLKLGVLAVVGSDSLLLALFGIWMSTGQNVGEAGCVGNAEGDKVLTKVHNLGISIWTTPSKLVLLLQRSLPTVVWPEVFSCTICGVFSVLTQFDYIAKVKLHQPSGVGVVLGFKVD